MLHEVQLEVPGYACSDRQACEQIEWRVLASWMLPPRPCCMVHDCMRYVRSRLSSAGLEQLAAIARRAAQPDTGTGHGGVH